MENRHRWERKAKIYYSETRWEKRAIAAGIAMDNRLNTVAVGPYGNKGESSVFDMQQWLAWFDPKLVAERGLQDKLTIL